jgi:hypothetical protein
VPGCWALRSRLAPWFPEPARCCDSRGIVPPLLSASGREASHPPPTASRPADPGSEMHSSHPYKGEKERPNVPPHEGELMGSFRGVTEGGGRDRAGAARGRGAALRRGEGGAGLRRHGDRGRGALRRDAPEPAQLAPALSRTRDGRAGGLFQADRGVAGTARGPSWCATRSGNSRWRGLRPIWSSRRCPGHERGSIILTSNGSSEGGPGLRRRGARYAILDRHLHHAEGTSIPHQTHADWVAELPAKATRPSRSMVPPGAPCSTHVRELRGRPST